MLVVAILLPQPQPDTPPSTSRCTTVFRRLRVSYRFAAYSLAISLPQCPLSIPFQFVGREKNPRGKNIKKNLRVFQLLNFFFNYAIEVLKGIK
jgi:hypothetical protein